MSDKSDSSLEALLTSGFVVFVGLVVQLGLGFLSRILIARFLGEYNYGAVSLGLTMLMSLTTVALLGTKNGVARYLPRYDDVAYRRGVIISAFQVVIPIAVVFGLAIVLFSDAIAANLFQDRSVGQTLKPFGAALPLAVLMNLTLGVSRGREESTPKVVIENFVLPLSQFGLITVALLLGYQASGISWAYLGAYLIVSIPCLYYLYSATSLFQSIEYVNMRKELFVFSLPLMTAGIMELIFEQLDTFIIGYYSSVASVGIYNSVYPIAVFLTTVLISFRFLAMPLLSKHHLNDEYEEMEGIFQTVTKWTFVTTVPLLFAIAFFPRQTLLVTFGPQYQSGATALSILAIGFFTHSITGLNGATLTSIGQTRTIMIDNAIVAVVNLVLNFLLIPQYGINGAAVATAVAYTTLNILFAVQLYRSTGIHPFTKGFGEVGVIALIFILGGSLLGNNITPMTNMSYLLFLTAFGFIYLIAILRFITITDAEMELTAQLKSRTGENMDKVGKIVSFIRQ